jgi:hypothetical protein
MAPLEAYRVQLLLDAPATFDVEALLYGLPAEWAPRADGEWIRLADAELSVRVIGGVPLEAQSALQQTWDWPEAAASMAKVRDAVELSLTSSGADRHQRLSRMQTVVEAALGLVETTAIHWVASERLVSVPAFRDAMTHGGAPTDAALNVRLFRVGDGRSGEGLMDTRGLAAFGLPDLECHFVGLDPGDVGRLLMAYADYVFDKGDVLHDDAMVRGVRSHEEWECRRSRAKALPDRDVVALVPAAPHAP